MVTICQLSPESWQVYKKLRLESITNDAQAFADTYQETLHMPQEMWEERIQNIWFAFIDDEPVGMIGLLQDTEFDKKQAYIVSFWVSPVHRQKGIGKKLIQHLQEIALSREIKKISLHVTVTQKPAIHVYESCGFKIVDTLKEATKLDQHLMEWLNAQ